MLQNSVMAKVRRNLTILLACAVFCVPALVPFNEPDGFKAIVAALIAYFAISVPSSTSNRSVGGLIFGTTVAILCLRLFFPSADAKNVWALALPAATITIRPFFALIVTILSVSIMKFLGGSVYESIAAIVVSLIISLGANLAFSKVWNLLLSPVNDTWSQIRNLSYIFLVCFLISTFYFAVGHWALFSADNSAYAAPEGRTLNAMDFLLYSGILNASGEPVYVSPIGSWARAWSLAQLLYAYAFSAIYFAVAVTKMMAIRESRS